jgi:hypothetical protein
LAKGREVQQRQQDWNKSKLTPRAENRSCHADEAGKGMAGGQAGSEGRIGVMTTKVGRSATRFDHLRH